MAQRTLDEIIQGFKGMSQTLGLTPSGVPYAQTPTQDYSTPAPGDTAASITSQYNYSGVANTQQSFQGVNMFRPGYGPDPRYMTPAQYGIFRPPPPPPPAMGSGILPSPMYPYPPMPGTSQFTPAAEFAANFALQENRHHQVQSAALGMGATRAGLAMGGGFVGSSVGAAVGGAFGGPVGLRAGAFAGGLAGAGLMGFSHAGEFASNVIWSTPMHNRMNAIRTQEMSNRFVSGGEGLGASGQGLSVEASGMIARELGRFADKSRGLFNRRDMMNIMQNAGDTGLLDFASNADKILAYVKTTAKVVATLSKITSDPDIKNNIQLLANMQRMGMDPMQALSGLQGMRPYSRLAGTSMGSALATHGMAGAATFQGMGLLPGQGMLSGVYGVGSAYNAVNSNAITPELAALMGGPEGMGQGIMQSQGAFMASPTGNIILAAMLQNKNGKLSIDQSRVRGLLGGSLDYASLLTQGQQNLNTIGNMDAFHVQRNELMGQLQNALSPTGVNYLMVQAAADTQRKLGGNISLGGALIAGGMDPNSANAFQQRMASPLYHRNERLQLQMQDDNWRLDRKRQFEQMESPFSHSLHSGWDSFVDAWYPFASFDDRARRRDRGAENDRLRAAGRLNTASEYLDSDSAYWMQRSIRGRPSGMPGSPEGTMSTYGAMDWWQRFNRDSGFNTQEQRLRAQGGITGWAAPVLSPIANIGNLLSGGLLGGNSRADDAYYSKFASAFDHRQMTDKEYQGVAGKYNAKLRGGVVAGMRDDLGGWFAPGIADVRQTVVDQLKMHDGKLYEQAVKNGTLDQTVLDLMRYGAKSLGGEESLAGRMDYMSGVGGDITRKLNISNDALQANSYDAFANRVMKDYSGSVLRDKTGNRMEEHAGTMQSVIRKVNEMFGPKDAPMILRTMALKMAAMSGNGVAQRKLEEKEYLPYHQAAERGLAKLTEKERMQFKHISIDVDSDKKLQGYDTMIAQLQYGASSEHRVNAMLSGLRAAGVNMDVTGLSVGDRYQKVLDAYKSNAAIPEQFRKLAEASGTSEDADRQFGLHLFTNYPNAGRPEAPGGGVVGATDEFGMRTGEMDRTLQAVAPALNNSAKNFENASVRMLAVLEKMESITNRMTIREQQAAVQSVVRE